MARGNQIIVSSDPKGHFDEGPIGDTSKPGTLMQIKANQIMKAGRFTWIANAPGTDGLQVGVAVLLDDNLQGKSVSDAFVSGTRCQVYYPIPGEELNVRVGEVAGTGNTFAIGDRFIVDAEDGLLVPETGSPQATVFVCLEVITQQAGGTLVWCKFLG